MNRISIFIFITLSAVESHINYNPDCNNAIRQVGLARKLFDDLNSTHPLKYILPIAYEYYQSNEAVDDQLVKQVEITRPLLSCLEQDSPQLIDIIRSNYMDFPPSKDEPYNLKYETEEILSKPDVLSMDVDNLVFKGQVKDGFFIEAGGHNFEFESTSLYFELKYNWTGLLVEPNKLYYQDGLKKKRKIYSTNSCLGMKPRPDILRYSIFDESTIENRGDVDMQCFPLYSLILAAGNPTVNYMSLDIEGGEFQVLLTLPWDKVDIEVMTLESHFMGEKTPGTLQDVIGYLAEKGYKHIPGAHKSKTFGLGEKVKLAQKDGANDAERIEIKRGAANSHCSGKEMVLTNDLFVRNDVALKYGL